MIARLLSLIIGISYTVLGTMGCIPVLHVPWPPDAPQLVVENAYGYLLGIFPNNVLLSLLHLATGIWGMVARSADQASFFGRSMTVLYAGLAGLGLIPGLATLFGLLPLFGANVGLHALTAFVTALIGWAPARGEARHAEEVVIAPGQGQPITAPHAPGGTTPAGGVPSRVTIAGCPLHPLLIPLPIGFLVSVCVTDLAHWWTLMPWYAGSPDFWREASFWLLIAGLGTGALAALVGLVDFATIRSARAHAIGWRHCLGNTTVLGLVLVNLLLRPGEDVARVPLWCIVLSGITALLLLLTSWWGGLLVFRYRIGVMGAGGGRSG